MTKKKHKLTVPTLRRRMIDAKLALRDAEDRYRLEIHALQGRCPHDWRYDADPSGNSDSGYHCCICGAYSRRGPKEDTQ